LVLPLAWLAAALMVKPFWAPPSAKPMPKLALEELLLWSSCREPFANRCRSTSLVRLELELKHGLFPRSRAWQLVGCAVMSYKNWPIPCQSTRCFTRPYKVTGVEEEHPPDVDCSCQLGQYFELVACGLCELVDLLPRDHLSGPNV
jgi:hypothetical protein